MEKSKYLVESLSENACKIDKNQDVIFLEGVFTKFGITNKNNRIYDSKNFIEKMNKLQPKIESKELLGELEHPDNVRYVSYKNVSHMVESLKYDEKTDTVTGRIRLLNTPSGRIARTLVENGVPLHISSRAIGSMKGNHVIVEELITYDLVAEPGFEQAILHTVNESRDDNPKLKNALHYMTSKQKPGVFCESLSSKNTKVYSVNENEIPDNKNINKETSYDMNTIEITAKAKALDLADKFGCQAELVEYTNDDETIAVMKISSDDKEKLSDFVRYCLVNDCEGEPKEETELSIEEESRSVELLRRQIDDYTRYLKKYNEGFVTKEQMEAYSKMISENAVTKGQLEAYSKMISENAVTKDQLDAYSKMISENAVTKDQLDAYSKMISENTVTKDQLDAYSKTIIESMNKQTEALDRTCEVYESRIKELESQVRSINEGVSKTEKDAEMKQIFEAIQNIKNVTETQQQINEQRQIEETENNKIKSEQYLVNFMPDRYKESWEKLSDERKKEILKESRLFLIKDVATAERFWMTRDFREKPIDTKKFIEESLKSSNKNIRTDDVQDNIKNEIMRRMKYGF